MTATGTNWTKTYTNVLQMSATKVNISLCQMMELMCFQLNK
jgi:hypothetical protein